MSRSSMYASFKERAKALQPTEPAVLTLFIALITAAAFVLGNRSGPMPKVVDLESKPTLNEFIVSECQARWSNSCNASAQKMLKKIYANARLAEVTKNIRFRVNEKENRIDLDGNFSLNANDTDENIIEFLTE